MQNKSKYLKISIAVNILFVLIIMLLSYKRVKKVIDKTFLDKKTEIVMFGNSITAWGDWDDLLDRNDVLTSGFPGYTSSHLALQVENAVVKARPKLCFLMVGINDIQVGIPIQRIQSNYVEILSKLRENNIKPVVESVIYMVNDQNGNRKVDTLNTFLTNYCRFNNLDYLDINGKLSTQSGLKAEFSTDGIHLNQKAYKIWANEINLYLYLLKSKQ